MSFVYYEDRFLPMKYRVDRDRDEPLIEVALIWDDDWQRSEFMGAPNPVGEFDQALMSGMFTEIRKAVE